MDLEPDRGVTRLPIIVLLAAACSAERDAASTATIAPAEARPSPTATTTAISGPITTSGSPPPLRPTAPGSEAVIIREGSIELRPLLPRAHTAFRVTDASGNSHHLVLRGASGSAETTIPANGAGVLQLNLVDPAYEIVCTSERHRERARFETYLPGAPL